MNPIEFTAVTNMTTELHEWHSGRQFNVMLTATNSEGFHKDMKPLLPSLTLQYKSWGIYLLVYDWPTFSTFITTRHNRILKSYSIVTEMDFLSLQNRHFIYYKHLRTCGSQWHFRTCQLLKIDKHYSREAIRDSKCTLQDWSQASQPLSYYDQKLLSTTSKYF